MTRPRIASRIAAPDPPGVGRFECLDHIDIRNIHPAVTRRYPDHDVFQCELCGKIRLESRRPIDDTLHMPIVPRSQPMDDEWERRLVDFLTRSRSRGHGHFSTQADLDAHYERLAADEEPITPEPLEDDPEARWPERRRRFIDRITGRNR